MSEAAWNKAFTQGSRALQDRLKKVHANNPKFQAWIQKSGHATDTSVKQASKQVKPTERVKKLQATSLKAYGSTKGTKVGGDHGGEDMRDTIAPLTRDQHSKVQAAERAAKAAAKKAAPAKPKKPLSQAERMAAIAKAVKKAKSKDRFDVPTVNPDDADHDDLRDVHQSLHVRRGYNEEVQLDEVSRMMDKVIKKPSSDDLSADVARFLERGGKVTVYKPQKAKFRAGTALASKHDTTVARAAGGKGIKRSQIGKNLGLARAGLLNKMLTTTKKEKFAAEEVETVEEGVVTAQKVMDRANVVAKTNPDPKKRFAASGLAQKAMMRTINPTGVNTGITRGGGNKTYRMVTGKVPPYQLTKKTGVSEEVELDEVTKQEAEKMLGGPVKTRTGSEPKGKLPLGFRRARNLARKAMKTVKESTTEVSEVNEMNHGKKLAKMIMAKQSQHPIAQNMGEENIVEQDDSMEKKEMAQTQLHFIKYAAEEILAFIDMGGEVEEWYQNKLSKVQSEVESLHSYIEGEKRRTGMVKEEEEQIDEVKAVKAYDKEGKLVGRYRSMDHAKQMKPGHTYKVEEEVEQVDEKAPPGAKYERMVKHIKKGYAKGGLTPQEKSIAYATAWKAYGKKEEVETNEETLDEKYMGFKKVMAAAKEGGARDPAAVAAAIGRKKYGKEKFQAAAAAGKKMGEEVEVVAEAEGTVAVTPKEKALAAHHGDPKKITYGDVIKARLKSAAAKKMGKQ